MAFVYSDDVHVAQSRLNVICQERIEDDGELTLLFYVLAKEALGKRPEAMAALRLDGIDPDGLEVHAYVQARGAMRRGDPEAIVATHPGSEIRKSLGVFPRAYDVIEWFRSRRDSVKA